MDPPSPLENLSPSMGGYGYFLEPHNKYMYPPSCILAIEFSCFTQALLLDEPHLRYARLLSHHK